MSLKNKHPRYVNKVMMPFYIQYKAMISRCTSAKNLRDDYQGNSVTPEWLNYDNWMDWAEKQIGFGNIESNGRLWSLDKDILLKGNKYYCPQVCVFIPNQVNQFFKLQDSNRGPYLLGASPQNNKTMFKCRINNGAGKHIYLGQYPTQEEAHEAYLTGKTNLGKELAEKYHGLIDERVLNVLSDFRKWYKS